MKICQFRPLISLNLIFFDKLTFFPSPYFDHDAFAHHALHVLDAPVLVSSFQLCPF